MENSIMNTLTFKDGEHWKLNERFDDVYERLQTSNEDIETYRDIKRFLNTQSSKINQHNLRTDYQKQKFHSYKKLNDFVDSKIDWNVDNTSDKEITTTETRIPQNSSQLENILKGTNENFLWTNRCDNIQKYITDNEITEEENNKLIDYLQAGIKRLHDSYGNLHKPQNAPKVAKIEETLDKVNQYQDNDVILLTDLIEEPTTKDNKFPSNQTFAESILINYKKAKLEGLIKPKPKKKDFKEITLNEAYGKFGKWLSPFKIYEKQQILRKLNRCRNKDEIRKLYINTPYFTEEKQKSFWDNLPNSELFGINDLKKRDNRKNLITIISKKKDNISDAYNAFMNSILPSRTKKKVYKEFYNQ